MLGDVFKVSLPSLAKATSKGATRTLGNLGKVCTLDLVVGLHKDLAKARLSDRVILQVELVKPVERIFVCLENKQEPLSAKVFSNKEPLHPIGICSPQTKLTCMSKVSMFKSYAVKFKLWKTSSNVNSFPSRKITTSSGVFLILALINRSRCFWFIHELW